MRLYTGNPERIGPKVYVDWKWCGPRIGLNWINQRFREPEEDRSGLILSGGWLFPVLDLGPEERFRG